MKYQKKMDNERKRGIKKISELLKDLYSLKKRVVDKSLLRDYDIYIRDIERFLEEASVTIPSLEDIQVYVDDYQSVILNENYLA
jgi:hypothetical protein